MAGRTGVEEKLCRAAKLCARLEAESAGWLQTCPDDARAELGGGAGRPPLALTACCRPAACAPPACPWICAAGRAPLQGMGRSRGAGDGVRLRAGALSSGRRRAVTAGLEDSGKLLQAEQPTKPQAARPPCALRVHIALRVPPSQPSPAQPSPPTVVVRRALLAHALQPGLHPRVGRQQLGHAGALQGGRRGRRGRRGSGTGTGMG